MKTNDLRELSPLEKVTLPTAAIPGRMDSLSRSMKRAPRRILGKFGGENAGGQAYHVMSRTTGGEMVFGETEKEAFRRLMWRLARFSGVEVLTYAVMGNHFHLLVKVPERAKFLKRFEGESGEAKLLEHLSLLYSKAYIGGVKAGLARVREAGREAEAEAVLETFRRRFCDLSIFVKELKERFSRWFNKHHGRRGTLWMDRFKSVLVEDGEALRTMALYIDLNPVRAGLVDDPKGYRWTGYGEATGGSKRARRGLCKVMEAPMDSWEEKRGGLTPAEAYRCWLFGEGLEVDAEKLSGSARAERDQRAGLEAAGRLKSNAFKDWPLPRHRAAGVFGPKGTIHISPARSAGLVRMPSAVLQGRIMQGSAAEILADPIPLPSRSRMKRPCRTPDTRRDHPALRAGLL